MGRLAKPVEVRRSEEIALIPVPTSLLVKAPPAFITQRNCFETVGISKDDFLRLAGVAFPVKKEGKLRIARYQDVVEYLQPGAHLQPKYERPKAVARAAPETETPATLDYRAMNRKAGLTKT